MVLAGSAMANFFEGLAESYELLVLEQLGLGGSDDAPWIRPIADLALFYRDLVQDVGSSGSTCRRDPVRHRSHFRSLVQIADEVSEECHGCAYPQSCPVS